jgi:hypothetical protein
VIHKPDCDADLRTSGCVCEAASPRVGLVFDVIDEHIPSLTEENEDELARLAEAFVSPIAIRDGYTDVADLAIRTCRCGEKIDGFYDYVDHLKAALASRLEEDAY